jgi:hypothetical protein
VFFFRTKKILAASGWKNRSAFFVMEHAARMGVVLVKRPAFLLALMLLE